MTETNPTTEPTPTTPRELLGRLVAAAADRPDEVRDWARRTAVAGQWDRDVFRSAVATAVLRLVAGSDPLTGQVTDFATEVARLEGIQAAVAMSEIHSLNDIGPPLGE